MEKIKVNMSPNPLDVQTIHASQNDGEARQWEFELHNNGELIDTSNVTEQLFFKAYKGGTEQLLPENTSTPTTSPFNGDIRYPQGLLTDQEFTYRQSPTEEDGFAKITDIKGNTLVWNQLWDYENISFQQGLTVTKPGNGVYLINGTRSTSVSGDAYNILKAGHKYLIKSNTDNGTIVVTNSITWQTTQATYILNATADGTVTYFINSGTYTNVKFIPQVIDLTQMFGSGSEPTTVEDFTSLFSLPYYAYNQGSLLSFNGNGIKTVGKNQIKLSADTLVSSQRIGINYLDNGAVFTANGTYSRAGYTCKTIKGQQYTLSFKGFSNANFGAVYISNDLDWSTKYGRIILGSTETNQSLTFTADSELFFVGFYLTNTGTSGLMTIKDIQLELGSSVTSYVPYTSSTLSLPISTYFPTGMKDVPDYTNGGKIYDEWTPSKATTRIGMVDLGSLPWNYTGGRFQTPKSSISPQPSATSSVICSQYPYSASAEVDKTITQSASYFRIYDSSYTDAQTFKTAMSRVYLYYELATPIETPITTASLVTENAEIPLSAENDVLVGKCTEELSAEPGFHDAKIKLSDADGECYSNKLQLHVERSPQ